MRAQRVRWLQVRDESPGGKIDNKLQTEERSTMGRDYFTYMPEIYILFQFKVGPGSVIEACQTESS
jgi:hypothetical protein